MLPDLTTHYLGLKLANPLVVAACPLTGDLEILRRLEEAGAAAAVLPSLFEEQLEQEARLRLVARIPHDPTIQETLSEVPEVQSYNAGPAGYLRILEAAKQAVRIPILASLNGESPGGWLWFARQLEDAGADALELNISFVAADLDLTAAEVEARYLDTIAAVRSEVKIPLALKVGPYFSAFGNFARRAVHAGANGLVLFNRFVQPNIDIEQLRVDSCMTLSGREELRLPLRWAALLHGRLPASLAVTSGVHFTEDVLKVLLAGGDVAMMASALFRHGPSQIAKILNEMRHWLAAQNYDSVAQIRGRLSHQNCGDPCAYERVQMMKALTSYVGEPLL